MSTQTPLKGTDSEGTARKFSKAKPLAARVGLHPKTLFRLASAGCFHRFAVNPRVVLFDEDEVIRFIESARVGGAR
jgi:hypothetical protein